MTAWTDAEKDWLIDELCDWHAAGRTITSFCRDYGLAISVVYRWLDEVPGAEARFARARNSAIRSTEHDMQDIADDDRRDWVNPQAVARDKLRVWTRQQLLARWAPPKQHVEHSGSASVTIITGVPQPETPTE